MIHPSTHLEHIDQEKGIGIIATEFIPKGTIMWVHDSLDLVFTPEQIDRANPLYRNYLDRYSYRNAEGDSILCWDHARYVHHSYTPNCLRTPYGFELAVTNISAGEEVTCDYGYLNVRRPIRFKTETHPERKLVYPEDPLRYHAQWDAKLASAFKAFNIVDQPLWGMIEEKYVKKVRLIALGKEAMDSTINLYFNPDLI